MDDLELLAEGGLSITEDDLAAYALRHEENAEREAWMQTEDGADARAEDLVEEGTTADAAEAGGLKSTERSCCRCRSRQGSS